MNLTYITHLSDSINHLLFLFVCGLSSHSRIFHSYGDVTIIGKGLQIWTYVRQSWPLSSEGSLVCHIYSDTKPPFIMVISEDPRPSHLLPSSGSVTMFLRLGFVAAGIRTPNLPLASRTLLVFNNT